MDAIRNMPTAGFVVILVIGALFVLAVVLLLVLYGRYRALASRAAGKAKDRTGFIAFVAGRFSDAYAEYGQDTNTPAVISDAIGSRLGGLLLAERFLNNSVSIFVTLGLFGTFLGLSLSVASLTQLIGYSNRTEWLSVLDSIGGGLLSALGGMGVAFYTSLVGAGCSILLTVLRTVFSPQAEREKLETRLELWLDTQVAPTLKTKAVKDEQQLLHLVTETLTSITGEIRTALGNAGREYSESTRAASAVLVKTAEANRAALQGFDATVEKFNGSVRDFGEVDYNLRGSIERMDLAVRDLSSAMREINRRMEGSGV